MIAKKDLVRGEYYRGLCRNAEIAIWLGDEFVYLRQKFGQVFSEGIMHPEDEETPNADIFVPFEKVSLDFSRDEYRERRSM